MGKITGFLEIERQDRTSEKPEERVHNYHEFVKPLANADPAAVTREDAIAPETMQVPDPAQVSRDAQPTYGPCTMRDDASVADATDDHAVQHDPADGGRDVGDRGNREDVDRPGVGSCHGGPG